ncbi:MAG: hypothetical protein NC332_01835 [Firmicutes bacterium]|nr:hypothetical protein [Bacillota bacterium]
MKKKIFAAIILCALLVGMLVSLTACGEEEVITLQTDKKYVYEGLINNETTYEELIASNQFGTIQRYYVFHDDGTGEYFLDSVAYIGSSSVHYKFTLYFKYTFADDEKSAVVCFFDRCDNKSVKIKDGSAFDVSFENWSELFTVSENVISLVTTGGYSFFINEDYAKTLTNFNKK